jgi:hypothetical protein
MSVTPIMRTLILPSPQRDGVKRWSLREGEGEDH